MSAQTEQRRFVVAGNYSRAEQWLDQILVIQPLRVEVIATKIGDSEATIARVIEVSDTGETTDHGEQPVFWSVVRGQLKQATDVAPFVAGRLVKVGNAYRLDPLSAGEEDLVDTALARVGDL